MANVISRREFLGNSAAIAAGLTIIPGHVMGKTFGHTAPSDKLNNGVNLPPMP